MGVTPPKNRRCGPSSQRSPGRLTGPSGALGDDLAAVAGTILHVDVEGVQLDELGVGEDDQ